MEAKKEIVYTIKCLDDVNVTLDKSKLTFKGAKGEVARDFNNYKIKIELNNKNIIITGKIENKPTRAILMTSIAHIKNMILSAKYGWKYEMQVSYSHFPMTVEKTDKEILIKNFLGEKFPRRAKIAGKTNVAIKGQSIILSGINLEEVSQTTANLEQKTKVRGRDIRRFTDGIYLIKHGIDSEDEVKIEVIRGRE